MLRGGRGWRLFSPFRVVPQHGPATHQQFSRPRDDRLLSTRFLAPGESLHQTLGPRVVTHQDPSRFDQHLPQQRRPSATDAALAIEQVSMTTRSGLSRCNSMTCVTIVANLAGPLR